MLTELSKQLDDKKATEKRKEAVRQPCSYYDKTSLVFSCTPVATAELDQQGRCVRVRELERDCFVCMTVEQ